MVVKRHKMPNEAAFLYGAFRIVIFTYSLLLMLGRGGRRLVLHWVVYMFGVPDRLCSGDLLHERQACWLDYTTGTEIMVRAEGFAPSAWCM